MAVVAFLGLWLACSWPWLSGGVTIPYDAKALFQAQLQFLANALHSGQSPAWNPHIFVGVPQIADPQSLIFSPAWLIAWWSKAPSFWSLDAYAFGLKALGGIALVMLFREHGWHPGAGLLAAVCFTFGGSAAWRIQHVGQIQSYAFFALALWLTIRATTRKSPLSGLAAGLAIGMLIVSRDQVAMIGCYLIAIIVATRWLTAASPVTALRQQLPVLCIAAAVGVVLAILPVAFTWAFLSSSNRPSIDFIEAARASLHPASLLSLFIADLYSAANPAVAYWGPYSDPWNPDELALSANMCQLYLGALPALLVLTATLRGQLWRTEIRPYSIAALVAALYALGSFTPAFSWMYALVPGVSFFRRPADATFLMGGMVAIVAGYGAHCWLTGQVSLAADKLGKCVGHVLLGIVIAAITIAISRGRLMDAALPLVIALLWLAAAAWLLSVSGSKIVRAGSAAGLLPAIFLAGDLAFNNGPTEPTGKAQDASLEALRAVPNDATIAFLKSHVRHAKGSPWRDRIEIAGLGFNWQNVGEVQGIDQTLGYNPLRTDIVAKAVGAGDYIAGYDQREFSMFFPSYHSQLANLLGLRYIASPVPIETVDHMIGKGELNLVARTRDAYIYENPDALPRVMFVTQAIRGDFDAILADGRWPSFDPSKAVLLEEGSEIAFPAPVQAMGQGGQASTFRVDAAAPAPTTPLAPPKVALADYQNTRVTVTVDTSQPGYLVLNDVWHPWWRATVDGRPMPLLKANLMFRAVALPAGRHVVQFEFLALAGLAADLRSVLRQAWHWESSNSEDDSAPRLRLARRHD
ncbi:MAG: hypothetical protein R3D67_20805 [Hyphomicrobiaceae bacterium]